MKRNILFTLLTALLSLAPAFADSSEVVVTDDDAQEEVAINQDCGCGGKDKDKKPPQ